MAKYFTWEDFDKSVDFIANKCEFLNFSGIYGIPRGGLCLSVALSHKLNLTLVSKPIKNSLIVDDIYETGYTLNSLKHIEGAMFFVLVSKIEPTWWNSANLIKQNDWIVFPWENKENYIDDQKNYSRKRVII